MAAARGTGETMAVTFSVVSTNTNIAANVMAMIKAVVTMEARIRFMETFASAKNASAQA
jgi:hypothetical protein